VYLSNAAAPRAAADLVAGDTTGGGAA
jgi:hypothetical protein